MVIQGYAWRDGFPFRGDANAFAEQLATLRGADGNVVVEDVLTAQIPEDAPLHNDIVWNDQSAAHQYRLTQVQGALGALRIIPVDIIRDVALPPIRAMLPASRVHHENGGDEQPSTYTFVVQMIAAQDSEPLDKVRSEAIESVVAIRDPIDRGEAVGSPGSLRIAEIWSLVKRTTDRTSR